MLYIGRSCHYGYLSQSDGQNTDFLKIELQLNQRISIFHPINSFERVKHICSDVIMSAMASQITSISTVYSTFGLGTDQRKHQSSQSLAILWGIHGWPVHSQHKKAGNVIINLSYDLLDIPKDKFEKIQLKYQMQYGDLTHQGPLSLTWFNFNPSMDK